MFGPKSKSHTKASGAGCVYVFGLGIMIVALLVFNAWIVEVFLTANNELNLDVRITQAAQFVLPVIMIFVQFWVFDLLVDYFRGRV